MPSIVLGSFGNVLSCLRGACGNFWGVWGGAVQSRAFGTCGSKHLLVSPCCLQVLWEEGGVLRPRRNDLEIQW